MNALDIIIGILLVFGLVRGVFRGLMVEIASIIGIFGGIYGAVFYYPAAAGAIFLLVSMLGVVIKYLLNIAYLGWFDRLCGAAFGTLKNILVSAVLHFVLTTFLPGGAPLIKTSRLAPHVAKVSENIVKIIPRDLKQRFGAKLKEVRQEWNKTQ